MASKELEGSYKKKVEEAVRLLRSVMGSGEKPSEEPPGPSQRTGLTEEGTGR